MPINIEINDKIAIITVDNPPVNALSQAVRKGLWEAVERLDADDAVSLVLLRCAGRTFIAGGDVTEFDKAPVEPHLPDVVGRIERAKKPWIAAIHGTALGGGLEVAMGCAWRVADEAASLGLPEVSLGVIPGAGGTVRTPRLIGIKAAIALVTGGKPVKAAEAVRLGLIDEVLSGDFQSQAIAFAKRTLSASRPGAVSDKRIEESFVTNWTKIEKEVEKSAKGAHAPVRALACLRKAATASADEAVAYERETFLDLRNSNQAKALRHVFFAERAALKPEDLQGVFPKPVKTAGVVGGGTMGAGIAAAMRDAGINVVLQERDAQALAAGMARIESIFSASVKRGRLSADEAAVRMAGVSGTTDVADFSEADLVVEAVFEDLDVKRAVFAGLAESCRKDAILATNTSYLNPEDIFAQLPNPDRGIGLHFFSPANIMKLLEIVPTRATAPDTLAAGFALAKSLRKVPVRSGICDGFIGNRILKVTRAQAEKLLLTGVSPAEIDAALKDYGLPMGPFAAQDLGGLDIAAFQRKAARARGETVFAPIADRLVADNRLGQKTGGGWYDYQDGSRHPMPSNIVAGIVAEIRNEQGRAELPDGVSLADAVLLPMVNEGARILDEGIAASATDIDLVKIHGYGHPRWRGGLMYDAQQGGLSAAVGKIRRLFEAGLAEAPSEHLIAAAEAGRF
ncbi:3-hydroxyacyl-CoA dehydrogenase [Roseibium hamelinense]|uniref:3-hydroxyacyl-CoA dehydrogenase n=1 Tax=Roseibium hamelinense TaxID=150831 RepID=A0A562TH30_9HYPH|nr:3-hydroxyacyl-CoA dehydrogenase NAD-binding domain-containing protein [Roseibium hamelinense]MTI45869.1 3-hydroxyacyl-CoA dehydrogenase [Roseibium hamelinense]TWI92947.1 3-hydroxyacyl-CoA dehydrogenase [Roseibium hamelinense]